MFHDNAMQLRTLLTELLSSQCKLLIQLLTSQINGARLNEEPTLINQFHQTEV